MKDYEFEVALSFAGEQRPYVETVATQLSQMGIKYFYDNHQQINLWGKNLIKYLDEIYYKKSKYCVMFISKEYYSKTWTVHESESAEERNLYFKDFEEYQQYILPVKFDDTKIPGVKDSWGYINANTTTPEELANMIYTKVKGCEYQSDNNALQIISLDDLYTNIVKELLLITEKYTRDIIVQSQEIFTIRLTQNTLSYYFSIKKDKVNEKTETLYIYDTVDSTIMESEFYSAKINIKDSSHINFINMGYTDELDIQQIILKNKLVDIVISKVKNILL